MLTFCWRKLRSAVSLRAVTLVPPTQISPQLGSIKRLMWRTSVDLPEPDKPMMQKMPPPGIVRLMRRKPTWQPVA